MWGVARFSAAQAVPERSLALPPSFLCPALGFQRNIKSPSRRSTRASSSSAPFRPTRLRNDEGGLERQRTGAVLDNGHHEAQTRIAAGWRNPAGTLGNPNDRGPSNKARIMSATTGSSSWQQEILLTQLAVKDIAQSSPAFSLPSDDLSVLRQAESRYYELCGADNEAIGMILAELALAYIHTGHHREAVRVLERHRQRCEEAGRSVPLDPWRPVFSAAYALKDYDLSIRLVRAGSNGSNAADDWLMVARLQAQLRLLQQADGVAKEALSTQTDRFWEEFSIVGRKAPDEIFTTLMKSQIERGRIDLIEQTIVARQEHGHANNQHLWRALLFLHPRGRRKAALQRFPSLLGLDGGKVFHHLVGHLVQRKDYRQIVLAFRLFGVETCTRLWRPRFATFSAVIHCMCALGKPDAAMRYLLDAVKLGVGKEEKKMYARVCARIVDLYSQLGRNGDALDVALQVTGVKSLAKNDSEERVKNDMLEGEDTPRWNLHDLPLARESEVYVSAIRHCARLEDPLNAVLLTRHFLVNKVRNVGSQMDKQLSDAIIRVLQRVYSTAKWRDMASALGKFADDAEKVPPAFAKELRSFIEGLRSHGFVDHFIIKTRFYRPEPSRDAQESLEWMTKPFRNTNSFVTQTPAKKDKTAEREERTGGLFDGMPLDTDPEVHLTPEMTLTGYSLRLRVFAVVRRDHESAVVVYRHMVERGLKPTSQHIAPIVEGLVLNGRVRDAIALRDGARKTIGDVESSMRIAVAIVRGHARLNDWMAVREELLRMRKQGTEPDASMWATVAGVQSKLWSQRQTALTSLGEVAKDVASQVSDAKKAFRESVEAENVVWSDVDKPFGAGKKPSLPFVVPKYTAMFDQRMYSLALRFMAQALDAGLRPDRLLHSHLVKNFQYLGKQAAKDGVPLEDALQAESPLYRIPLDHIQPEYDDDGDDAASAKSVKEALAQKDYVQGKAMHWAPLLQLSLSNMNRTSTMNPHNVAVRQRDREARRAMLQLIFDTFASRRLIEEAEGQE